MRRPSKTVAARNQGLVERIRALKAEHPFWGFRRVWAYLRYVEGWAVNKKRILRLMRHHQLLVTPNLRLKAKRTSLRPKPKATAPNQWWGIDMTKVLIGAYGWVYLVIVLDWYTKKIVGHQMGLRSTARDWLEAVDQAVNRQFPQGIEGHRVHLMSDNGCQPTSLGFMKTCRRLGIQQAFTSYNNPKGNADTERMIRTIKEECLWLREWNSPVELTEAFRVWVESYNESYLHSALGYQPPNRFEQRWLISQRTQFPEAC